MQGPKRCLPIDRPMLSPSRDQTTAVIQLRAPTPPTTMSGRARERAEKRRAGLTGVVRDVDHRLAAFKELKAIERRKTEGKGDASSSRPNGHYIGVLRPLGVFSPDQALPTYQPITFRRSIYPLPLSSYKSNILSSSQPFFGIANHVSSVCTIHTHTLCISNMSSIVSRQSHHRACCSCVRAFDFLIRGVCTP